MNRPLVGFIKTKEQLQEGEDKLSPYIYFLTMQPPISDPHIVEPNPPRKPTRIKPLYVGAALLLVLAFFIILLLTEFRAEAYRQVEERKKSEPNTSTSTF